MASKLDPRPERSEEHTSELQSQFHLVCRLLLEKKKKQISCARYIKKEEALKAKNRLELASSSETYTATQQKELIRFIGFHPLFVFFFFNDTATTEIYTLSLHDALPILPRHSTVWRPMRRTDRIMPA